MKYVKRALSLVLAVLVVMSVMVIPAFAANTSDEDFWYYTAPASSYNRITGRQKTDTTPVYVCVSESANNIVSKSNNAITLVSFFIVSLLFDLIFYCLPSLF